MAAAIVVAGADLENHLYSSALLSGGWSACWLIQPLDTDVNECRDCGRDPLPVSHIGVVYEWTIIEYF